MINEPGPTSTTKIPILILLLLVGGLAGCAIQQTREASDREAAIQLAASLVSPANVALEWKSSVADAAGLVVEFATEPNGEYTIIEFLPPAQTRFVHPDLMPETTFHYRVRPYYGPASNPVEVALPEPSPGEKSEQDDHAWAYPQTLPGGEPVTKQPIRNPNAGAGAPADLKATIMHSSGIRFTWTDHASDEEGYLLESKPQGNPEFGVVAVIDPDINSFGIITLPNEKNASFRVRAFYYGKPSNLVHETTGPEPVRK